MKTEHKMTNYLTKLEAEGKHISAAMACSIDYQHSHAG